jgi:filamentous hemagglutinin family protein
MLGQQLASAAPQGGQVNSGEAVISQSVVAGQSVTTITQSTAKASLNWQSFNIGIGESVRFVQPSASSVTVNRINDLNGSKILGKLCANGQVWLINPAGVYFGPGAQVNVGGLIAASVNLPDHTDPLQLRGPLAATDSTASMINEGRITTSEGGYAALLGANVSNLGNISSPGGRILLLGDKQSGTVYLDGRLDTYSLNSTSGFIETSAARVRIR